MTTTIRQETEQQRIQGIVFDLDGTLLDSLDDIADSVNIVLDERGHSRHPVAAYRYFVGDGAATLMHRVLPEAERTPTVEAACLARFNEVYALRWNNKTRPYPGIMDMLTALVQWGVPLAVLSNKPHDATALCVRELLPGIPFAVVLGQKPDIPRKPDPTGALAVARMLNIGPDRILYVGDTATDMQTAVASGMMPLGVLWGFRTADELLTHGARTLVNHPGEIVDFLARRDLPA